MRIVRLRSSGFTMVELVIVIVVMSLVALAGIEVIRQSSESYLNMSQRQTLTSAARLSVERLSREFRHALPGSLRVSGSCIEFMPISVAGVYVTAPVESSDNTMEVVRVEPELLSSSGRVAIYSVGADVYDNTSGVLSPTATIGAPDVNNVSSLSWSGAHQFPFDSPGNRFFMVDEPISYCLDGSALFRYSGYGVLPSQPAVADLPAGLPDRALLVNEVVGPASPFSIGDPGLSRNAIVMFSFNFVDDNQAIQLTHEAQLRNVP